MSLEDTHSLITTAQKLMCNEMLMKPEMQVITNTQKNRTHYAGGTEYNSILHISVHSGTNNFCHEVETAWLEILEDKFKYISQ